MPTQEELDRARALTRKSKNEMTDMMDAQSGFLANAEAFAAGALYRATEGAAFSLGSMSINLGDGIGLLGALAGSQLPLSVQKYTAPLMHGLSGAAGYSKLNNFLD